VSHEFGKNQQEYLENGIIFGCEPSMYEHIFYTVNSKKM